MTGLHYRMGISTAGEEDQVVTGRRGVAATLFRRILHDKVMAIDTFKMKRRHFFADTHRENRLRRCTCRLFLSRRAQCRTLVKEGIRLLGEV